MTAGRRAGPAEPAGERAAPEHPTSGIDETVHQRHRLGILTITAEAQQADFGYLREALGLTPCNLSRHLTVLEEAGLIQVEKGYEGRRPRTWVRITRPGRAALAAEIATLTELVRRHGPPPDPASADPGRDPHPDAAQADAPQADAPQADGDATAGRAPAPRARP